MSDNNRMVEERQDTEAKEKFESIINSLDSNEENISSGMIINGIDINDMQKAYEEGPILNRWHTTTLRLIPDLYENQERLIKTINILEKSKKDLESKIEELEKEKEEKENVPTGIGNDERNSGED